MAKSPHELGAVQPKSDLYFLDCFIWRREELQVFQMKKNKNKKNIFFFYF